MSSSSSSVETGIGFGVALAMIVSYGINHSIGWAIWHGMLGWIYVIYRLFVGY